jgi:hypothetical protein
MLLAATFQKRLTGTLATKPASVAAVPESTSRQAEVERGEQSELAV